MYAVCAQFATMVSLTSFTSFLANHELCVQCTFCTYILIYVCVCVCVSMSLQPLESLSWQNDGVKFVSSHSDSSIYFWAISSSSPSEGPTKHYGKLVIGMERRMAKWGRGEVMCE